MDHAFRFAGSALISSFSRPSFVVASHLLGTLSGKVFVHQMMQSVNIAPRTRGFTLIELLMTVAIIGVLASVVAPIYQDYIVRAQLVETGLMLGQWGREFRGWEG